jgi:regulator of cell morphogenesis and NO signaling
MINDFDRPVSEIVKMDYRTADVFRKRQINFCCGGGTNLKALCETKQLDFQAVVSELTDATRDIKIPNQINLREWRIDFLVDFVKNVHHDYISQVLPPLKISLDAFALTHSHKFPELESIIGLVEKLSEKLKIHNSHEDQIIFPYIKQMYSAYTRKEIYGNLFVRTLRKPLSLAESEQKEITDLLNGLKSNTINFQPPAKSCSSYEVLISKLKELYENLLQHQYLEQNILFPRAVEIEQRLLEM